MTETADGRAAVRLLSVPAAKPVEFEKNLIRLAVCELRFPTLLELETEMPVGFQKALRKEYPFYEPGLDVAIQAAGAATTQKRHGFKSRDKDWTVALRPSSLAIETTAYRTFEDLLGRVKGLLKASSGLIDSDFFTRVGLRYINIVPVGADAVVDWLNPDLVKPLEDGVLGDVDHFFQEIRGKCEGGTYTLRHGLKLQNTREYVVDFDFSQESVPVAETLKLLESFHSQGFGLFIWTLGDRARKYLGKAKAKGER